MKRKEGSSNYADYATLKLIYKPQGAQRYTELSFLLCRTEKECVALFFQVILLVSDDLIEYSFTVLYTKV